jgi:hypothetical protein
MQRFREKYLRLTLSFFTGLIFLNMGFFLMEVRILELHKNRQLMQNISKMLAGAALEEERDCPAGSAALGFAEEEYMAGHQTINDSGSYFLIAENVCHLLNDGTGEYGYLKRFCPPPEV